MFHRIFRNGKEFVQPREHLNATSRPDTEARSRLLRGYSPSSAYVRAPLYRVVGIIHIASGGVKVVIPRAPPRTRFFSFIYVLIRRRLLCVLD